jgi:hypothetical protein
LRQLLTALGDESCSSCGRWKVSVASERTVHIVIEVNNPFIMNNNSRLYKILLITGSWIIHNHRSLCTVSLYRNYIGMDACGSGLGPVAVSCEDSENLQFTKSNMRVVILLLLHSTSVLHEVS